MTDQIGDSASRSKTFTDEDVRTFARISQDENPVHLDDAFAAVYRSEFKENLVRMVRLARRRFDPVILLPTGHVLPGPYDMEAAEIFYRAIREVAVDLDCRFVPVHTFWAGFLRETDLDPSDVLQADPRWPNEKGHEILARAILPVISAVAGRRFRSRQSESSVI